MKKSFNKYTLVSWSGGKDAMMALLAARGPNMERVNLFSVLEQEQNTVNMHGVPMELLREQARALHMDIEFVKMAKRASDDQYCMAIRTVFQRYKAEGYQNVVYGDIFLEELRSFKEELTISTGLNPIFPLWGQTTHELAQHFIKSGYQAVVTSVDSRALDWRFVGLNYDESFLHMLPKGVDPCGEKGEFHTFVWNGPGFNYPINYDSDGLILNDNRFYQLKLRL